MRRFLITPSLHSDWRFYNLLESKEKQDFLDVLTKKPREQSEAMLNGIAFEDNVKAFSEDRVTWDALVDKHRFPYANCVRDIAGIVQGGLWQEKVYIDLRIHGIDFLLYGKADVIKRNWVYDIKFTSTYDIGKFVESIQHDTYLFGSGLPLFKYLITDGKSWWAEDYALQANTEERLRGELASMIDGIYSDADFRKAYDENWGAKY